MTQKTSDAAPATEGKTFGETQEQFARRMGTTVRTIARWEGPRPPTGRALVHLEHMAAMNGASDSAATFRSALNDEMGPRVANLGLYRTEEERDLCLALLVTLRDEKHKRRRAAVRKHLQPALADVHEQDLERRKHSEDSEAAVHLLRGGMDIPGVARRLGLKREHVELLSEELKRGSVKKRTAQSSGANFTRVAIPSASR